MEDNPGKILYPSDMAVNRGKLMRDAAMRGLTRNRSGLMSMVSRASICS